MNPYVELLYTALQTRLGIIVQHDNPQNARSQFYSARKAHGDPVLNRISITLVEGQPKRLYLVKCPDEKKNLLTVSTSSSTGQTSNGSSLHTAESSPSPEPSET